MHHLACHHWSKFQTKLTTLWGVLTKKPPKSNIQEKSKQWGGEDENMELLVVSKKFLGESKD